MANSIKITDLQAPELDLFARLSETELLASELPDEPASG